jgi:hypothetical protein
MRWLAAGGNPGVPRRHPGKETKKQYKEKDNCGGGLPQAGGRPRKNSKQKRNPGRQHSGAGRPWQLLIIKNNNQPKTFFLSKAMATFKTCTAMTLSLPVSLQ